MSIKSRLSGSLTVEAAIVLPVVLCIMISLLMFIRVLYIHRAVQHAIVDSAMEIASSSYYYQQTGVKEIVDAFNNKLDDRAAAGGETVSNIMSGTQAITDGIEAVPNIDISLQTTYDRIESGIERASGVEKTNISEINPLDAAVDAGAMMDNIMQNGGENLAGDLTGATVTTAFSLLGVDIQSDEASDQLANLLLNDKGQTTYKTLVEAKAGADLLLKELIQAKDDPVGTIKNQIGNLLNPIIDDATTAVYVQVYKKVFFEKHFKKGDMSFEDRLLSLGVDPQSFNFKGSKFYYDSPETKDTANDAITIKVNYKVKSIVPIPILGEIMLSNHVTVRAWLGGNP